jgi:MerR family transcriptional regulator/heat shock protein HspR
MISAVAELYDIHPQTLRMYEREGLLSPSRSDGNTRLYSDEDLRRLEVILSLTRDLGVNLAGVEVVLNMRRRMRQMQRDVAELITFVRDEILDRDSPRERQWARERIETALARVEMASIVVRRESPSGSTPPAAGDGESGPTESGS